MKKRYKSSIGKNRKIMNKILMCSLERLLSPFKLFLDFVPEIKRKAFWEKLSD